MVAKAAKVTIGKVHWLHVCSTPWFKAIVDHVVCFEPLLPSEVMRPACAQVSTESIIQKHPSVLLEIHAKVSPSLGKDCSKAAFPPMLEQSQKA